MKNTENTQMNNTIIYFDMDGVLAKWQKDGKWQEKGYYRHLDPDHSSIQLLKALVEKGYEVAILSAVPSIDAEIDKILWLNDQGLGDIMHIFVPYGSNKAEAVQSLLKKNKVLIDDFSDNLRDWKDAGNISVKYRNGINGTNGTWKDTSIRNTQPVEEMMDVIHNVVKQSA